MTPLRLTAEVRGALDAGRAVVALESSVLAQGLPVPANRHAAERMDAAVRRHAAVPAVTAVVRGHPAAGVEPDEMEVLLRREGVGKVSARELPVAVAREAYGATTVSAALVLARLAGIRVFATGGIGGVHREPEDARTSGWVRDESADLTELARTPCVVVCAGAKSILDLPATMERLETLGVTVVGYGTSELPGFFTPDTGIPLPVRVDDVGEIAAIYRTALELGRPGALLVVQPPPAELALPRETVEAAVERALARAHAEGVRGAAVTPFLLGAVERETGGRSLGANLALLERNASLAAEVAVALAARDGRRENM